jgi:hypothetical protein
MKWFAILRYLLAAGLHMHARLRLEGTRYRESLGLLKARYRCAALTADTARCLVHRERVRKKGAK